MEARSVRILRRAALAAAALVCGAVPLHAALDLSAAITRQQTILLDELARGTGQPSNIKLRRPLVDSQRNRVYFAGTVSPYLGVIDANTDTIVDSVDLDMHGYLSKQMALDEGTGLIYMTTLEDTRLYKVDPVNKTVSAPVSVPGGGAVSVDSVNHLIYVAVTDGVREYNSNLQLIRTLAASVRDVKVDPSGTYLYTTPMVQPSSVTVYNRSTFAKIASVNMPGGRVAMTLSVDSDNRIYAACLPPYLAIISTQSSSTDYAIRSMVAISTYVGNTVTYGNNLYMMTGYPPKAGYMPTSDGAYGVIEVHNKITGVFVSSVQAGLQGDGLAIHPSLGKMYVGNTGDSYVDVFDLATNARTKRIDTATSVEDIVVRPGDGALVVRNRLGGGNSLLLVQNPGGSAAVSNAPSPGNWPTKTILDAGTTTVYTLSHYESKVSAFDLDTLQVKAAVSLGVAKLRTDGLSTMAFNPAARTAYATLPELGQVVAANVDTGQASAAVSVPGFDLADAESPGLLQLAVNSALGRVYLLNTQAPVKLFTYDSSLTLLRSTDVSSNFPTFDGGNPLDLFFSDEAAGKLYVGPLIFNVTSGGEQYAGKLSIADGQGFPHKVVAVYPEGDRLYAVDFSSTTSPIAHDSHERLLEFSRSSPAAAFRQFELSPLDVVKSAFGFDFARGLAYVGYFESGNIDVLKIGNVVSAVDVSSPSVPAGLTASAVGSAQINLAWSVSTDDVGVAGYKVYRAGVQVASATTNSYTDSGLSAGTTYTYAVAAYDAAGNTSANSASASTATAAAPPAVSPSPFLAVSTAGLTATWLANGNSAGTTYYVQLSSAPDFSTILQSTRTLTLNASFFGLSPNTSYYVQAAALSLQTSTWTAFVLLGSTATPAARPSGSALLALSSTTAGFDWQPGGNPEPGTQYETWLDADPAFGAPAKALVSTSAYEAQGLSAATTYYFKVRAWGRNGAYSLFDAALSTVTPPPPPGWPGTPAGTALGISSVSWNWTPAAFAATYGVYQAASPATLIASVPAPAFAQTGLSTNTAYGIVVAGINATASGPLSASATAYTLAAAPSGTAISNIQAASATITWSLNTNPSATTAEVQRSSDNASFAPVFTGAATTFADTGLLACTTYYVRVRNRNGDGVATDFDATVQFKTLASTPMAPGGLAAVSVAGNKIALSWTESPTEGITAYRLYSDGGTGVVDYGAPLAVLSSTKTAFTTGVLASSASYRFALRAKHRCGVEESGGVFASAASSARSPPSARP
ncbi:MAG TPA: hypothetical protein DCZ01_08205 [Elusimicrobia bacterium]|nr:hypothetical protein [Elusimicrobiota bacterium]